MLAQETSNQKSGGQKTIGFNIPRQRADLALTQFAEQAGLTLIFPYDKVRGRPANRLVGHYTEDEAIEVLLRGSGLKPSFSDQRVLNIVIDEDNAGDKMNTKKSFLAGVIGFLVGAQGASAQSTDASGSSLGDRPTQLEEIIVTGTQLRGVEPTGATVTTITREDAAATGATTVVDLLSSIPQVGSFGTTPNVGGNGQLLVNPVNLRQLPLGIGATSPTLILMDGRRLVGVGIQQNIPDPDLVPLGAIERVDVVPDGGSSIYGADAVGGVVNFITRKDFDGVEISARQGLGKDYKSSDVSITLGRIWADTSAYVAFDYSEHDEIWGKDRSYVKDIDWNTGLPLGLACDPPNVGIGSEFWAVNTDDRAVLTPGTENFCDLSRLSTIYPEGKRHAVLGSLSHDINENVSVDVKGWMTNRENISYVDSLRASARIDSSNPLYISTGGSTAADPQTVSFNFSPILQTKMPATAEMSAWGFTPAIRSSIGNSWQMRAHYNYGYSESEFFQYGVNNTLLPGYVSSGLINPYDIAASNPDAIRDVLNYVQKGYGENELHNFKAVFDGPLFELPGGEVAVAFGAEYSKEQYKGRMGSGPRAVVAGQGNISENRDVKALFAEINIPIIGENNRIPGIYEFSLAASYRFDRYSDFGNAESPNLAFSYKPVEWVRLRGRWNESFLAPGLADLAAANTSVSSFLSPIALIESPFEAPWQTGEALVALQGTNLPISPSEAEIYSFGVDIEVPFVDNVEVSFGYFSIDYKGQISIPPNFRAFEFYSFYTDNYLVRPSFEEAEAWLQGKAVPQAEIDNVLAGVNNIGYSIYAIHDARKTNIGFHAIKGFDLSVKYYADTSFGSIFASLNGTLIDESTSQATKLAPKIDNAGIGASDMNLSMMVGATYGSNISARATMYHVRGFDLPVPVGLGQRKVDDFNVLDLHGQYDFLGDGWARDLSVSLTVKNIFDENPPIYRGQTQFNTVGYAGETLGRVVQLGFNKRF